MNKQREEYLATIMDCRNIREVCPKCQGLGVNGYAGTSTWRGGIGGSAVTVDVCDKCWGSGDIANKWPDRRKLEAELHHLRKVNAKLLKFCESIIDDATGDIDNPKKRVWPIRSKTGREIRLFVEQLKGGE